MYLSVEDYKIMTEFLFDDPKSDKDILKAIVKQRGYYTLIYLTINYMFLNSKIFEEWCIKQLYKPLTRQDRLQELQDVFVHTVVYTNIFY